MTAAKHMAGARSWLFVPGDSERKMAKALDGEADIVLLDLEDAVTEEGKVLAREQVSHFITANQDQRSRLWVRINPLDGPHALADLAAIVPAGPGGIMLPKANGREDVEKLDHILSALEVAFQIEARSIHVIVLITETAQAMFATGTYKDAPRLVALSWGAEDLADALGAATNKNADGAYKFTFELARSLTLLGAAAAGVAAIDTISADFSDLAALRARAEGVRQDGFTGMLAIHPAQVDVINAAFTPTEREIADAQAIVDLFAANPGVGAIGFNGKMVDRPYLSRAEQLLRRANSRTT